MPENSVFDFERLAGHERREVAERGVVFLKGDSGDHAYVVASGAVEIRGGGRAVERIGQGEMFGEMAVIDGGPRSASAVAVLPTELIAIGKDDFLALVRADPDFALYVMRMMARRLRAVTPAKPSAELVASVTPMAAAG